MRGGARNTMRIHVFKDGEPSIMFERRQCVSSAKFCDKILSLESFETGGVMRARIFESLEEVVPEQGHQREVGFSQENREGASSSKGWNDGWEARG